MLDQPWVASRMHALGVAPAPVPFKKMTVDKLTAAITLATALDVSQRARDMAKEVQAYDGLKQVCDMVEEAAEHRPWPEPGSHVEPTSSCVVQ